MIAQVIDNQYDSLLDAINGLERRGFSESFLFINSYLYNASSGERYGPHEINITEVHQFDNSGDYHDLSILYAVDAPDGTKGLIIDSHGTYSDLQLEHFIRLTRL